MFLLTFITTDDFDCSIQKDQSDKVAKKAKRALVYKVLRAAILPACVMADWCYDVSMTSTSEENLRTRRSPIKLHIC